MAQLGKVDPSEVDRYAPPDPVTGDGVQRHIGLVRSIANRHRRRIRGSCVGLDDLSQAGALGIMRAARTFEVDRGVTFATFAGYWVRHFIDREISNLDVTIRVPVHRQEERHRAGLPPRVQPRSIDAYLPSESENPPTLHDRLAGEFPSPEAGIEEAERKAQLQRLIDAAGLSAREMAVLQMRFGLETRGEEFTLDEIGRCMGFTRERSRQLEVSALDKLQRAARRLKRFPAMAREAEAS